MLMTVRKTGGFCAFQPLTLLPLKEY